MHEFRRKLKTLKIEKKYKKYCGEVPKIQFVTDWKMRRRWSEEIKSEQFINTFKYEDMWRV
jgi:hypothetical protein